MHATHPFFTLSRQRWWARCLLVLMLLVALAPTVSRAMAAQQGAAGWVELCTSAGTRWVQVNDDTGAADAATDTAGAHDAHHALDACGYCVLASERFAPMLPTLPAVLAHAPAWVVPAYVAHAPATPDVPRHAARDPPL